MPLIDLTRQIKNTGSVTLDGSGSTKLEWEHANIVENGSVTAAANDGSSNAQFTTHSGHGLEAGDWVILDEDNGSGDYTYAGTLDNVHPNYYKVQSAVSEASATTGTFKLYNATTGTTFISAGQISDWGPNATSARAVKWYKHKQSGGLKTKSSAGATTFSVDSATGDTSIAGNLTVLGTSVLLDTASVDFSDSIVGIGFDSNSAGNIVAGGTGGIQIGVTGLTENWPKFVYNDTDDEWEAYKDGGTAGDLSVAKVKATGADFTGNVEVKNNNALKLYSSGNGANEDIQYADAVALAGRTNLNSASALVQRDGSGDFSAGTITASLKGIVGANNTAGRSDAYFGDVVSSGITVTAGNLSLNNVISSTGDININPNGTSNTVISHAKFLEAAPLVDTATAKQVFFAGSSKELQGSTNLTYDGDDLKLKSGTVELSDLDANQIPYSSSSDGRLLGNSNLTWNNSAATLAVNGILDVDNLKLDGSTIEGEAAEDLTLLAKSGQDIDLTTDNDKRVYISSTQASTNTSTGALVVAGGVGIGGALNVAGSIVGVDGNVTLGSDAGDNIVFGGEVDSHIMPDDDVTFDIGSGSKRWNRMYAKELWATTVSGSLVGNVTGNVSGNAGTVTNGVYTTNDVTVLNGNSGARATTITTTEATNFGTAYAGVNNATNANTGSTIVKRDGSGNFSAGTITATLTGTASDISNHGIDDLGTASGNYSMNSNKLTNVLDPSSAQDVATKNYVDQAPGGTYGSNLLRKTLTWDSALDIDGGFGSATGAFKLAGFNCHTDFVLTGQTVYLTKASNETATETIGNDSYYTIFVNGQAINPGDVYIRQDANDL